MKARLKVLARLGGVLLGLVVVLFLAVMFPIPVAVAAILMAVFPALRTALFNLPSVFKYTAKDLFLYIRRKRWRECKAGELNAYTGLFGKGKTLSAVHKVTSAYRKYNGQKVWCSRRKRFVTQIIRILSNVDLKTVPYEPFDTLQQVINYAETREEIDDRNETHTVLLVLGDEFSVQMNSRTFKSNIDPLFLNTLLTCRHYFISIYYTTQRFKHVDALLRQVTSFVIDCDKVWRFQCQNQYSAWEMENAADPLMLKPKRRMCWYVRDDDYRAYDTLACVGNLTKAVSKDDMLTADEILAHQGIQTTDMNAVAHPSRKWTRTQRKVHKG
jgi:hypothetical protein